MTDEIDLAAIIERVASVPLVIAGTGHRPDKLGGYDDYTRDRLVAYAMLHLNKLKPSLVISGMALGWDQALAQAAYMLAIPFDAYVPFPDQHRAWPAPAQGRYEILLERARTIQVSRTSFTRAAFQERNEAMVNNATSVLALWNGSPGGTANCVRYALDMRIPVINAWDDWQRYQGT